jgi:hypothetical protein
MLNSHDGILQPILPICSHFFSSAGTLCLAECHQFQQRAHRPSLSHRSVPSSFLRSPTSPANKPHPLTTIAHVLARSAAVHTTTGVRQQTSMLIDAGGENDDKERDIIWKSSAASLVRALEIPVRPQAICPRERTVDLTVS